MLKLLRPVLELILLTIAIIMGYPHFQTIINSHSYNYGYWAAFTTEWGKARFPMLVSMIIVVAFLIFEYLFLREENRRSKEEEKRRKKEDRRWDALFRKLGIDSIEYEANETKRKGIFKRIFRRK